MNQGLKSRSKIGDVTLSVYDREVIATFFSIIILVLYIGHNHFVSDRATRGGEESSTPEVLPPESFLELRELLEYLPGRLAFEILRHFGDGDLRWHGDKEMNMVFGDMTTDDFYVVGIADLSDEIAYSGAETARQDWFVILGSPDQMVLTVEDRMRCLAIEFHPCTVSS